MQLGAAALSVRLPLIIEFENQVIFSLSLS